MNEIKKKIILDLLVTPITVAAGAGGSSILLISWAVGASAIWPFFGVLSLLVGVGAILTNWIFNLEKISLGAIKALKDREDRKQELELDSLDELLVKNGRDPRDQTWLRELRTTYKELKDDASNGKLSEYLDPDTLLQVDELFQACVKALRYSHSLLESCKQAKGRVKEKIMKERESVMDDIGKSVERFGENVSAIRALSHKTKNGDMAKLRAQLDRNLDIARRTEDQMKDVSVEDRYREFLPEKDSHGN